MSANPNAAIGDIAQKPHVIKGEVVTGAASLGPAGVQFRGSRLDSSRQPGLAGARSQAPPFHLALNEIHDLIVATGERTTRDPDGILAQACEQMKRVSPFDPGVLDRDYAGSGALPHPRLDGSHGSA